MKTCCVDTWANGYVPNVPATYTYAYPIGCSDCSSLNAQNLAFGVGATARYQK